MAVRNHAESRPSALSALTLSWSVLRWRMSVASRREHFREIAASLALHADGGDEEQQIILADPTMQIDDGRRDILAERNFLGGYGELGRDRVAHFPGGKSDRAHERVADPQAAHDDVERVRQLGGEGIDPPSANDGQIKDDAQRADNQTDARGHPQMRAEAETAPMRPPRKATPSTSPSDRHGDS